MFNILILTNYEKYNKKILKKELERLKFNVDIKNIGEKIIFEDYYLIIMNDISPYNNVLNKNLLGINLKYKYEDKLIDFINEDKLILGINSGFDALLYSDLLDIYQYNIKNYEKSCNWCEINIVKNNIFLKDINKTMIYIPTNKYIDSNEINNVSIVLNNYIIGIQNKKGNVLGTYANIDKYFHIYNNPYWSLIKDEVKYSPGISLKIFENIINYLEENFR